VAEQIVVKTKWGEIRFSEEWDFLELNGLAFTADVPDTDVTTPMDVFKQDAATRHPNRLIVDTTEFHHRLGDETMRWRDVQIILRYNRAGDQQVRVHRQAGPSGTDRRGRAKPAPHGPATFLTVVQIPRRRLQVARLIALDRRCRPDRLTVRR
jgi:hypothetical protein